MENWIKKLSKKEADHLYYNGNVGYFCKDVAVINEDHMRVIINGRDGYYLASIDEFFFSEEGVCPSAKLLLRIGGLAD